MNNDYLKIIWIKSGKSLVSNFNLISIYLKSGLRLKEAFEEEKRCPRSLTPFFILECSYPAYNISEWLVDRLQDIFMVLGWPIQSSIAKFKFYDPSHKTQLKWKRKIFFPFKNNFKVKIYFHGIWLFSSIREGVVTIKTAVCWLQVEVIWAWQIRKSESIKKAKLVKKIAAGWGNVAWVLGGLEALLRQCLWQSWASGRRWEQRPGRRD